MGDMAVHQATRRSMVETVFCRVVRQRRANDRRNRRHDVGEARRAARWSCARLSSLSGQRTRNGNAVAAFPTVALHPTPRSSGVVTVIGTHVNDACNFGAVIASENDNRVIGDAEFLQSGQQLADDPVELMNEITVRSGLTSSPGTAARRTTADARPVRNGKGRTACPATRGHAAPRTRGSFSGRRGPLPPSGSPAR